MTDSMNPALDINEQDALKDLIHSDGWTVFLAHIEREWGAEAFARRVDAEVLAARKGRASNDDIAENVAEIAAVARHMRLLAQWPGQRVKALAVEKKQPAGIFAAMRRA